MKNSFKILIILFLIITQNIFGFKLSRGSGLWYCENSNTFGKGNIWINGHGRAFYWDNPDEIKGGFPLKIFPCLGVNAGVLPFADVALSSEVLTYGFQIPGNIKLKTKFTVPNNLKLRMVGGALSVEYTRNFLKEYASIGGYRNEYVGFYAEGVNYTGNSMEFKLIGDVEFMKWKSFLPFKFYLNLGYKMPFNRDYAFYDQYIISSGIEYKSLTTDFFIEFHMEILRDHINTSQTPLKINFNTIYTFPHYFRENPMYLTPGIRIRYENGLTLLVAVPLQKLGGFFALSKEEGYPNGPVGKDGWTDGFSPFYAEWKLVGKMSFPIKFNITSSEMVKKFLLMKNKGDKHLIDIDDAIGKKKGSKNEKISDDEKRLKEIEKRRENMMKENLLD